MGTPSISLRLPDDRFRVLTPSNTIGHFTYLGLTNYTHDLLWVKVAVGVPGLDDEIISVVKTAERLGYEPHPSQLIIEGRSNGK